MKFLARVAVLLPLVEVGRWLVGPGPLVSRFRSIGLAAGGHSDDERRSLRRAISLVDRCMPGGRNCYRRVLLEIGLDAGAASETVHLGLKPGGGRRSGHAWLGHLDAPTEAYPVVLDM